MRLRRRILDLARSGLVLLFALWLPAGPLLSSAAASSKAAQTGCKARTGKIGCHGSASSGDCHGPKRRVGCHDAAASAEKSNPGGDRRDTRREKCGCSDLAISSSHCGCRHGSHAAAVTIDRSVPKPTYGLAEPVGCESRRTPGIDLPLLVAADPPDPPPRLLDLARSR